MEKEAQIIHMLEQIMTKLDKQEDKLNRHTEILHEHSEILNEHSKHHQNHYAQFKEHGQILSALRTGQEYLKAEIDGMKIYNEKEFTEIKERLTDFTTRQEVMRNDIWENKVEIHRLKNRQ